MISVLSAKYGLILLNTVWFQTLNYTAYYVIKRILPKSWSDSVVKKLDKFSPDGSS